MTLCNVHTFSKIFQKKSYAKRQRTRMDKKTQFFVVNKKTSRFGILSSSVLLSIILVIKRKHCLITFWLTQIWIENYTQMFIRSLILFIQFWVIWLISNQSISNYTVQYSYRLVFISHSSLLSLSCEILISKYFTRIIFKIQWADKHLVCNYMTVA